MASPAMKRLFLFPSHPAGASGRAPSRNAMANDFRPIWAKMTAKLWGFITKIALKSQNATKGCCEVD